MSSKPRHVPHSGHVSPAAAAASDSLKIACAVVAYCVSPPDLVKKAAARERDVQVAV